MNPVDGLVSTPINLTVPVGATYLQIKHESYRQESNIWLSDPSLPTYPMFVDLDVNMVNIQGLSYTWTPNSSGIYLVNWFTNPTDVNPLYSSAYNIYVSFVDSGDFFNDYPQYASQNVKFVGLERKVRRLLESYCDQTFQPWINKCVKLQGTGTNALTFDKPVLNLIQILESSGYDLTKLSQIDAESPYYVERVAFNYPYYEQKSDGLFYDTDIKRDSTFDSELVFKTGVDYYVTADFGSYDVPPEITEAAKLLIADEYSGVAEMRNHGITQAQLGDYSYTVGDLDSTTGNTQADILISSWTNSLNIRLI